MKVHQSFEGIMQWAARNAAGPFGCLLACACGSNHHAPSRQVVTYARAKWCVAGAKWWDGNGYQW